jgi:hypothetical protein
MYVVGCLVLAVTMVGIFKSSHSQAQKRTGISPEYLLRLQSGLGTEVNFANTGESLSNAQASIDTLATFIEKRSAYHTPSDIREKLAILEYETQTGKIARLPIVKFNEQLTNLFFKRVKELSPTEVDQTVESLRGFNHPDLPESIKNGRSHIKIRPSHLSKITPEVAKDKLRAMQLPSAETLVGGEVQSLISQETSKNLRILSSGLSNFRSNWNLERNQAAEGLSPMQAYWLLYSAVSGDKGLDNEGQLNNRMQISSENMKRILGRYPSYVGSYAYGDNGYVYSSPVSVMMNTNTVEGLLEGFKSK